MAELKKFLFDNFIVERGDTKIPEPIPEIEEAQILEGDSEDKAVFTGESQEEIIEDIPEEKFSREELEAKAVIAEQSGYEKGYATAKEEQMAENNHLLINISQQLETLLTQRSIQEKEIEQEAVNVIKQALQELVPTLLEEQAIELVNKFLKDNFNNFKHNEKLSFYIHPDTISYVQENIIKLANSNDFEGKISIHKDSSLDKSSCRVEWDNGGVEYAPQAQLAQVEQILDK